jgi:hypothetical protein
MKRVSWCKVKNGKRTRIAEPKSIEKLLDQDFVVAKTTEEGGNFKIETFSPRTREEAWQLHRKKYPGLPF